MSEIKIPKGKEKRILKSSAKVRSIDVKVGKKGLTENVILEIQTVLNRDKMVKVSFNEDRKKRIELVDSLQNSINSTLIELVGKTATFSLIK
jgi:RNA-binding protein YhbY